MYCIGQRWYSEGEPELGLGVISAVENKRIELHFPLSSEGRIYSTQNSPLKRFELQENDTLETDQGVKFTISDIRENEGILFYLCGDEIIPEMNLSAKIDLNGPLQRLLAKNFDSELFFSLRYQSYLEMRHYQSFKFKGFLGAKIRLIPHQVYVVNQVLKMQSPKVMLCDEVGLGKTIEAALILNSLIQKELISNILIVVPDSLVFQWFIELYKKFNLSFHTLNSESDEIEIETVQRLIVSSKILQESPEISNTIKEKDWDLLVLDESHQLNFAKKESPIIQLFSKINANSFGTIFLSATPEVLGVENLFHQLNFLDPNKYTSFENFSNLISESKKISKLIMKNNLLSNYNDFKNYFTSEEFTTFTSDEELKQTLIDRFGTGRNYFRNSRKNLENYNRLFNDRILHNYPIKISGNINDNLVIASKTNTVYEIINKFSNSKILILCHSKAVVQKLQKSLLLLDNFKLATFHSDQSLMERDRQASYFADEDGAQILISTEVGSEGRNFEFSNHLILFDLPKLPDQLEQRIGRLDRIGQKNDINVHIPFIEKTFEDLLFNWYHNVFQSFTSSPKGANAFYQEHQQELKALIESSFDIDKMNKFINEMKEKYQLFKTELETGRDLIIETHSYNDSTARNYINEIKNYEEKNGPKHYIENVCNSVGISNDELNDFSYYLKPTDNMLLPSFPGLSNDGLSFTYDREYALKYEKIALLNWEHPIAKGCFEILLSSQLGNMTIIKQKELPRDLYFEFIVTLQCSDEHKHTSALYMPFTPLRVLLNAKGDDLTKSYPKQFIDNIKENLSQGEDEIVSQLPKDLIAKLFNKALDLACIKSEKYKGDSYTKFQTNQLHEAQRLEKLNIALETKHELQAQLKTESANIKSSIYDAKLAIDSVRIILPSD